jgi:hypothetical protein
VTDPQVLKLHKYKAEAQQLVDLVRIQIFMPAVEAVVTFNHASTGAIAQTAH